MKVTTEGKFALNFLSSLLLPFIETYWVTMSLIKLLPPLELHTLEMLEIKVQTLAEAMFNEGFLIYFESCSRESIDNAINQYSKLRVLNKKEVG